MKRRWCNILKWKQRRKGLRLGVKLSKKGMHSTRSKKGHHSKPADKLPLEMANQTAS